MTFQTYNEETATTQDRIAWVLCQIIDDDAPLQWTRYRSVAEYIAADHKLMDDLSALRADILLERQRCTP